MLTGHDPRKMLMCRYVRVLNEHLRAVCCAFDFIQAALIGKLLKVLML